MSGRKSSNITISQSRYDRMKRDTRRADNAAATAKRKINAERSRNKNMQKDFLKNQRLMQQEYRNGLEGLSQTMRDVEIRQSERMENIRFEMFDTLEDHRREINAAMSEHRVETEFALQGIRDKIQEDKDAKRHFAETQIDDMEHLIKIMDKQGLHNRFTPGELENLRSRLQVSRGSLDSGLYEAAFGSAKERYFEYHELERKIAEREAEWTMNLKQAMRLAETTSGAVVSAEEAEYEMGKEGGQFKVNGDVDFWSYNRFSELIKRFENIQAQLENPIKLSIDSLKNIVDELTPMTDQVEEIVHEAKDRLIQSQHRQNIAASILESFDGTHWQLDDSAYEGEDFREGVHVKLKNDNHESIVASVIPKNNQDGTLGSTVEINFFDNTNDERLRSDRLTEIHSSIKERGVEAGNFQCLDDSEGKQGNISRLNFNKLRQKVTSKK